MAGRKSKPTAENRVVGKIEVAEAYRDVFSTPEGQIVLADLMRHFGYNTTTTFVAGDQYQSARNEGSRIVLVHIGRRIDTDIASLEATEQTEQ